MIAWEQYSLLIDISSILQECAHFCTSTTKQRQLMLHTTSFMYAAQKPSVYFTSVFKVYHLNRGAWTVLYSTRGITKRNADFWKGGKTHTVNPNTIWMQILSNLVSKGNKTSKTGPCVPRRRFNHSTHCSLVLEVQIFWLYFSKCLLILNYSYNIQLYYMETALLKMYQQLMHPLPFSSPEV